MNHLNYFNPYKSKEGHYEDQLTRAYLVLLKYSFHAFSLFFDYCRSEQKINNNEDLEPICLITCLEEGDYQIETQRANPNIDTNVLLSVLITDSSKEIYSKQKTIKALRNGAVYDGLITFGSELTLIIENKPSAQNVWIDQLNPSREGLSEDTTVYQSPVILEWKQIIKQLNSLLNLSSISGSEAMMINDFLEYIDHKFPTLNPYDRFHLCKNNEKLLERRIIAILEELSFTKEAFYHQKWGYYIKTNLPDISRIGLILEGKGNDWRIELSLVFGDTQTQAKSFYSKNPDITNLSELADARPNFHVSHMNKNLVWYKSPCSNEEYIEYWKNNKHLIKQQKREDVRYFLDDLQKKNIIKTDVEIEKEFFKTNRQTLNVCPGFAVIYSFSAKEAVELDNKDQLTPLLIEKIIEALSVIGEDGSNFLKK